MILTVFRSRLRPEAEPNYRPMAARMSSLAAAMPGYLSHKSFTAEDGERVTIVEFASEEAQRAWARHAEHLEAQHAGRRDFYADYSIQVCTVLRESKFKRE